PGGAAARQAPAPGGRERAPAGDRRHVQPGARRLLGRAAARKDRGTARLPPVRRPQPEARRPDRGVRRARDPSFDPLSPAGSSAARLPHPRAPGAGRSAPYRAGLPRDREPADASTSHGFASADRHGVDPLLGSCRSERGVMRHFCTYFDRNYLSRGLALYRSLQALGRPFQLWVLCMDPVCHAALASAELPGIRPIALEDFERGDDALLRAKANRTLVEYYFTCTASLPRYVFREEPGIDLLTYVDADLYFFADPEPLFEELAGGSIAIIEHRISKRLGPLEQYGRYNVGWISFRRDANGMACLEWWRDRCLAWCYDRLEPGRF